MQLKGRMPRVWLHFIDLRHCCPKDAVPGERRADESAIDHVLDEGRELFKCDRTNTIR